MTSHHVLRSACLVLATGLLAAGCSTFDGAEEASPEEASGGAMTIALAFGPDSGYALETDDAFVLSQVGCLETLVRYDADAGALEPGLATSWEQSTPTTWDFTLREGVRFQDGEEMTSDAVVAALEHLLEVEAPPRAFGPAVVSGVEATGPGTVRVTSPEPSPLVPFRLASVNTGILAPAAYTSSGINPMQHCTGPFAPVDERPDQSLSLERNDDYWGTEAALATVEAKFLGEGSTRATQVRTGESQIALGIPAANAPDLESDPEVALSRTSAPRTTGLYFNTSRAPFDSEDLRRAVQSAVDLDAIATGVYDGGAVPAPGPFAQDEPFAPEGAAPVDHDVERARALLESAGFAPGELDLTLIAYVDRPEFSDLASVIAADLAEIGVDVTIRSADYAAVEPDLLSGDFDMALLSRNHLADIGDPIGFLSADYACDGSYNISQHCDATVDGMLTEANGESDPEVRYASYAAIAQKIQDEAITVSLVNEQSTTAQRKDVQGFVDDPLGRYVLTPALTLAP